MREHSATEDAKMNTVARTLWLLAGALAYNLCSSSAYAAPANNEASSTQASSTKDSSKPLPSLQKYCAQAECRKNITVTLQLGKGKTSERSFALFPPAVQPPLITLLPGERIFVEVEENADTLSGFRGVHEPKNPARTIEISFRQEPSIGDGTGMILEVKNPFSKPLKYNLSLMMLDGRVIKTSSCPAPPKGTATEHWPHPVFQLVFKNLHLLAESESSECVY